MKIAYIVLKGIPYCAGIEKYTEEIGSRLASRGHEVIVYTMRHYGTSDGFYRGMRIKTVPSLEIRCLEKLSATLMADFYQCVEQGVDIVHYHAFGPSMFCFIPMLLGRKVVVQGHGIEWKRSKWGIPGKIFLKLSEIPSVRIPPTVTVVSKALKNYISEKYGVDCIYIPPGINPPKIEEPNLTKKYGLYGSDYILFAGRFEREKGIHYLIQAYNQIKTDLKLVICGNTKYEGKYKSELYQLARGNKNIIFTGFVMGKVLQEFFSNCYIFVLPSEVEGLSTSLLEAMGYGNCCLVSDIPENLEALNNSGYIFKNKDVGDLIKKLEYLINNPEAVKIVKEKAKNYVIENFLWDKIASDFEKLYSEVLSH